MNFKLLAVFCLWMFVRAELFLRGSIILEMWILFLILRASLVSPSSLVDDSYEISIIRLMRMAMFPWLCRECTSWKARENQGCQALFVPRAVFKHSSVFKFHDWQLVSEYQNSLPFPFSFLFACPCPSTSSSPSHSSFPSCIAESH